MALMQKGFLLGRPAPAAASGKRTGSRPVASAARGGRCPLQQGLRTATKAPLRQVAARVAAPEKEEATPAAAVKVVLDNESDATFSVLTVEAPNRPGTLTSITVRPTSTPPVGRRWGSDRSAEALP